MKNSKPVLCLLLFLAGISVLPAQVFQQSLNHSLEDNEISFDISLLNDGEETSFFGGWTGEWNERKHPFVALSGAFGFNLLLATWNRYMIGSAWAKTGWEQWNHFWERGLAWDRDWYWTNFVLHPYQGSMYYMASRGANLNQLESLAVTFLGSYMWEYLCETNAPSKNDMVYTTIGSFAVGEMLYRLSAEAEEINSLLKIAVNPQSLWTEYIWRIKSKKATGNIYSLSLGIDVGNVVAGTHVSNMDSSLYPQHEVFPVFGGFEFHVDYNDPYRHDSNIPYRQFTLEIEGKMGKGSGEGAYCAYPDLDEKLFYNVRIFSDGMLIARNLPSKGATDTSLGAVMMYDFDWQSFYMFSTLAPGFAFKQRFNRDESSLEWQAMAGVVLLGSTDYYYTHRKVISDFDGACYSHTMGAETVLKLRYKTEKGFAAGLGFRGYAMYDFKDQMPLYTSTGWEYFGILSADLEVPLSKKVRVGLKDEVLGKITDYNDVPNIRYIVNTAKAFAKLQLK